MPKYSVIIPVYNRPDEMAEMLESLVVQSFRDFEVVIVEDGSTETCEYLIDGLDLDIRYFFKENTGPGDSRNFGMKEAVGDYFLFFDSDCVLPSDYFDHLDEGLGRLAPDAFGGPDDAHDSFTTVQKAINYSMTSFFTTGGIRGGRKQLDKFQPRSFNMGLSREVYDSVGGFSEIHPGEDPDLSFRIINQGFKVSLIPEAKVYHKRRIDFSKFLKQVYKFGVVRVILNKWHPRTGKLVYWLPTIFLLGCVSLLISSVFWQPWIMMVLVLYCSMIFVGALTLTKSLPVAITAVPAAFIQLIGYGWGYLKSYLLINVLRLDERKAFSSFFFTRK